MPDEPDELAHDPDVFPVWPENWDTVRVFIALGTQWRREYAGMDAVMVWQGLRYGEAEATIRLMGLAKRAGEIFDGLRVMESAALPILNKR